MIESMSCYECNDDWDEVAKLTGISAAGPDETQEKACDVSELSLAGWKLKCMSCGEHAVEADQMTLERERTGQTKALRFCSNCDSAWSMKFMPAGVR